MLYLERTLGTPAHHPTGKYPRVIKAPSREEATGGLFHVQPTKHQPSAEEREHHMSNDYTYQETFPSEYRHMGPPPVEPPEKNRVHKGRPSSPACAWWSRRWSGIIAFTHEHSAAHTARAGDEERQGRPEGGQDGAEERQRVLRERQRRAGERQEHHQQPGRADLRVPAGRGDLGPPVRAGDGVHRRQHRLPGRRLLRSARQDANAPSPHQRHQHHPRRCGVV